MVTAGAVGSPAAPATPSPARPAAQASPSPATGAASPEPAEAAQTRAPVVASPATSPTVVASPAAAVQCPSAAPSPASGGGAAQPSAAELTIGTDKGAELRFEPSAATVRQGAQVTLTFKNESTQPHNLFFQKPMDAGTKLVVPADEQDAIRFTAPAAGTYQFVCTIHPNMMGALTVQP